MSTPSKKLLRTAADEVVTAEWTAGLVTSLMAGTLQALDNVGFTVLRHDPLATRVFLFSDHLSLTCEADVSDPLTSVTISVSVDFRMSFSQREMGQANCSLTALMPEGSARFRFHHLVCLPHFECSGDQTLGQGGSSHVIVERVQHRFAEHLDSVRTEATGRAFAGQLLAQLAH
jgi:hypothetical protein